MTKIKKALPYIAVVGVLGIAVYAATKLLKTVEDMELDLDFGNDAGLMNAFGKRSDEEDES